MVARAGLAAALAVLMASVAVPANATDPNRHLAVHLDDDSTIRALSQGSFAAALVMVEAAAQTGPNRPGLIIGLLDNLPTFSQTERLLLLVRFLELSPDASPDAWSAALARVEEHPFVTTDAALGAAFLRLSARHRAVPRRGTLLRTGLTLNERLDSGWSDPTIRRWTVAFLDVVEQSADSTLAGAVDQIARRAGDREIIARARDISRALFD
ncbi:MAG: hypothetical protein EA403_11480 [Spirochaetaceae bacterium]|nr:MAG: hypothetical protein EA403_11480 [Spirochaetaceae bacterium]